jgi:hypothetical protein
MTTPPKRLPHRRHRRVRRRARSAGTVPAPRAAAKRHGLCRRPAPGPGPQGHDGRAAAAHHQHAGAADHRPPQVQPNQVYVIPPNRELSILHGVLTCSSRTRRAACACRSTSSCARWPPTGRSAHRRHPLRHGLGRHAGAARDQGQRRRGVRPGPCQRPSSTACPAAPSTPAWPMSSPAEALAGRIVSYLAHTPLLARRTQPR